MNTEIIINLIINFKPKFHFSYKLTEFARFVIRKLEKFYDNELERYYLRIFLSVKVLKILKKIFDFIKFKVKMFKCTS